MNFQLIAGLVIGLLLLALAAFTAYITYRKNRQKRIDAIIKSENKPLPDFKHYFTNRSIDLNEMLQNDNVLVVFLRHFGCTFCRSTIAYLADERIFLEAKNIQILFVHPGTEEQALRAFERWGYPDAHWVADPDLKLYEAFELKKGNFKQLFGIETWIEGFKHGFIGKKGVGLKQEGNGFQMPGVFFVKNGIIKAQFIHERASDQPDYLQLIAYSKDYIVHSLN
jgi:peroxiredoxin